MNGYLVIAALLTVGVIGTYTTDETTYCENHSDVVEEYGLDIGNTDENCTCGFLDNFCTRELNPVCASDGGLYSTFCVLCGHVGSLDEGETPVTFVGLPVNGNCSSYN